MFGPEVLSFMKEKHLPQKTMLLSDSVFPHPIKSTLISHNGLIAVNLLLPGVTSIMDPVDQGVKLHYSTGLLRTLAEDNKSIAFWRKMTVLDTYIMSPTWFTVKPVTLVRSGGNFFQI
jgi:hypothetical protein